MSDDSLVFNLDAAPAVQQHEDTRTSANLLELLAKKGMEARGTLRPPTVVPNPFDETFSVRFRTVVPARTLTRFTQLLSEKKEAEAHIVVLTAQCEAVLANGKVIEDDAGSPVTFTHEAFSESFGGGVIRKAIEAFYGGGDGIDGAMPNIGWVVDQIFTAAGLGVRRDEKGRPLEG